MMRGYGASPSSRRLVYMGLLKYLHGDSAGSEECIRRAETAIRSWYPEHFQATYKEWIEQVKARLNPTRAPS
jgi:hypothetical protein